MSETFEVGQKVKVFDSKSGEIICGPVRSTFGTYIGYVVRVDEGGVWFKAVDISAIPEQPKFAIGDKVTAGDAFSGEVVTVVAGPFVSRFGGGRTFWVVERGGVHAAPAEDTLTKVDEPEPVKVGDRVRVLDDDCGGRRFGGRIGVVKAYHGDDSFLPYRVEFGDGRGCHGDPNGTWNCRTVERVGDEDVYEHAGVIYELGAKYRDSDRLGSDVWRFERRPNGTVRGTTVDDGDDETINDHSSTLASVVEMYGPLTRVTD
ncbi:phiSA1p31-related protein [Streptomyces sp. NPDC086782]|uniref:phiSA1p31-related protein n=1 Tax=Streptomyces sp. NPDC086782 TaxID=3365757 RepID=UPI0038097AB9